MAGIEDTLIVTMKEKGSKLIPLLEKEGISIRFMGLKLVDFIVAGKIAIIKRTMEEFVTDLRNKMIYRTAIEFKRDFRDPLYIIEGGHTGDGATSTAVRAGITYLTVLNRIPIIFSSSVEDTSKYLSLLLKQAGYASEKETVVLEAAETKSEEKVEGVYQLEILTRLPGINEAAAVTLMKKFGNLRSIFSASERELQSVKGIGVKRAKALLKALEAPLEESDKSASS